MFNALADHAHRRPKLIVAATVLAALAAGALGGSVADRMGPYEADDPATDTIKAEELIARSGVNPGTDLVVLLRTEGGVRSAAGAAAVQRLAADLQRDRAVGRVLTYREGGRDLVSRDGRSTYLAASFKSTADLDDTAGRIADRLEGRPGVTVGGGALAERQVNEQVSEDLARAEMLAFPILFVLSFLFFRSLVAALLPVLVGGISIVLTFLGLRVATEFGEISVFALNLVTGLGLGLAIDYSLFIVSRYREEIALSGPGLEALRATLSTAGRTVLFSSLTVTAALAALLVFPQGFLYSMGIGGMMVSLIAAGVALLVLPAVLALLGKRVNSLAPKRLQRAADRDARPAKSGAWYRLSQTVMRRPGRIAIASAAVMIALGLPALGINFTSVDPSVLPPDASARQVDEALTRDFPPGRTVPIYVAVESEPGPEVQAYARELRTLPNVDSVSRAEPAGEGVSVVNVYPRTAQLDDRTQDIVRELRELDPPFPAYAGGFTADFVDLKQSLVDHMPLAALIIVLATLVVLFLMTGSVVLPIKALVMNVLTISATFGLLVLIFQDGRFESLLDYTSQGALEATQPIVLVAVAFGLSTDYGVFLLSRIKEARDRGASNREAVAIGLERTGRIVTAAAVLFCVAIGAFATSQIIFIKEVGVGTAMAVLIDATIIRALLVPSLMELLGKWNWWSPRPLRRLHERIGLAESGAGAARA
ncbi:MAG TPA: MMPL family transporter [Thermoleophilaceae bacterium]|nr:MMPL family transporter [Thermoleophilaceae bacterium]